MVMSNWTAILFLCQLLYIIILYINYKDNTFFNLPFGSLMLFYQVDQISFNITSQLPLFKVITLTVIMVSGPKTGSHSLLYNTSCYITQTGMERLHSPLTYSAIRYKSNPLLSLASVYYQRYNRHLSVGLLCEAAHLSHTKRWTNIGPKSCVCWTYILPCIYIIISHWIFSFQTVCFNFM